MIFGLLQNEKTREDGRKILQFEHSIRVCKGELSRLIKRRDGGASMEEQVAHQEEKLGNLEARKLKLQEDYTSSVKAV